MMLHRFRCNYSWGFRMIDCELVNGQEQNMSKVVRGTIVRLENIGNTQGATEFVENLFAFVGISYAIGCNNFFTEK